jgi:hypothetical protein
MGICDLCDLADPSSWRDPVGDIMWRSKFCLTSKGNDEETAEARAQQINDAGSTLIGKNLRELVKLAYANDETGVDIELQTFPSLQVNDAHAAVARVRVQNGHSTQWFQVLLAIGAGAGYTIDPAGKFHSPLEPSVSHGNLVPRGLHHDVPQQVLAAATQLIRQLCPGESLEQGGQRLATILEQKKFHEYLLLLAARNEARAQCNRLKDYFQIAPSDRGEDSGNGVFFRKPISAQQLHDLNWKYIGVLYDDRTGRRLFRGDDPEKSATYVVQHITKNAPEDGGEEQQCTHGNFFDAKDVDSLAGTLQHSSRPNLEFEPREDGNVYVVMAPGVEQIRAGTEATVDYGKDYFEQAEVQRISNFQWQDTE